MSPPSVSAGRSTETAISLITRTPSTARATAADTGTRDYSLVAFFLFCPVCG